MSIVAVRRPPFVTPTVWFRQRLVALVLLMAIADYLFYKAPAAGLPVMLFLVMLFAAAATFNRIHSSRNWRVAAVALLAGAVAALVVDADLLSVPLAIALSGTGVVLLVRGALGWLTIAATAVLLPLLGWLRLAGDVLRVRKAMIRHGRLRFGISGWIVPVGLSGFFIAVFLIANPVIDRWAGLLAPDRLMFVDSPRLAFWAVTALLVWPFLHMGRDLRTKTPSVLPAESKLWTRFFGDDAIRRSLVSFNLLFGLQTLTDLGYLWGGMDLPEGLTHAEYAHRGAYPLMVAVMVAAAFVLIALRGDSDRRRTLKPLLVLFVGQGLLLVVSSMLRLDLYVEAYSLTLWRVAALVWMGLVAFGFLTILVRILAERSTRWLVNVNATVALLTLWGCCFVNFAGLVISFNITHSREASGRGPELDLGYIVGTFGARAIPAFDAHRDLLAGRGKHWVARVEGVWVGGSLDDWRDRSAAQMVALDSDWRTWSLADWWLKRYLSEAPRWGASQSR